jgi:hypothetical protein
MVNARSWSLAVRRVGGGGRGGAFLRWMLTTSRQVRGAPAVHLQPRK